MNRFTGSADDDSFDDILAGIDESNVVPASGGVPSQAKKTKISDDFGDDDSFLANVALPDAPTTSVPANLPVVIPAANPNSILVNPKQRGNPILKSITNIPWEFDETIIPDYVVGSTAGVLYLSLRYHQLNPDYIHNRLKLLGKRFELRVLLVQVDTKVFQFDISYTIHYINVKPFVF